MRSKVGHYDIVEELGRGGMGVVYKGFESALNRHVAIKIMSESLAHDAQVVERFLREARSMAQLNDPHIIQIYMIGEDAGQPFFAMEFVEGESLSQTLRREARIDPKRAVGIIAQAAQGLSVAHDRGVVHRDIKPANLMLTPRGLVKVADFGIALSHDFDKKLTGTGEFVGTPGYLSPEVCLGKNVDQRSDIFSLGIVLFEMLAGRMPFTDQSPLGLMLEVVRAEIPDVRSLGANVSPELVGVLNKMLAKDPDTRYASCHDLLADINATGLMSGAQNIAMPAAGITSASTLPQGVRAPQPQTAPRAQLPQIPMQPPQIPAATRLSQAPFAAPGSAPGAAPGAQAPMPPVMPQAQPAPPQYHLAPQYNAAPIQKKASALPWAIAAGLLIAGASGAYMTKDRWLSAPKIEVTQIEPSDAGTTNTVPQQKSTSPIAQADSASSSDATSTPNPGTEGVGTEGVGTDAPAIATTPATDPAMAAKIAEMAATQEQQKQLLEQSQKDLAALKAEQATNPTAPAQQQRQPLAALRDRVEQISKSELSPPVANAQRTPTVAAAPRVRMGVAVVALGDMGAAGAAEQAIEDALSSNGYTVIDDEVALAGMRGRGTLAGALKAAQRAGISGLVVVRVTKTGTQDLQFYGNHDTRTLATLEVKAFDTRTGAAVGSWREDIGYTGLNAAENGREGVATHLRALVAKMAAHKARG
jgi:eukaryotic-like serine/threonine-protein kinase